MKKLSLLILSFVSTVAVCGYGPSPKSGTQACDLKGSHPCPDGYYCANSMCWTKGSGPGGGSSGAPAAESSGAGGAAATSSAATSPGEGTGSGGSSAASSVGQSTGSGGSRAASSVGQSTGGGSGSCATGVVNNSCNLEVFVAGEQAQTIRTFGGYVYWSSRVSGDQKGGTATIKRRAAAGNSSETLVQGENDILDLQVDATGVYWWSYEFIASQPQCNIKSLIGGQITTIVTGALYCQNAFAVDTSRVYFQTYVTIPGTQTLSWAPRPTGPVSATPLYSGNVNSIVAVNGKVFWTGGGYLHSVSSTGGDVTDYSSSNVGGVMTDGANLFWTFATNGVTTESGIQQMPAAGGDVVTVVSGQNGITSMAVDDTYVYFNDYRQNIKSAPKGVSGSATVLARLAGGTASTDTMAVDDSYVYFNGSVNGGTASIVRTRKHP